MPKKKNVLIACGGTGGHLFPGIAVAEELKKQGHNVLLLISEKKVDSQASEKYGMLDFITVPAIAKPSTFSLKMLPFLLRLQKSIRQCRAILKEHQCDIVLGMGGFTSLPPVYAGKRLGLATYVHDSNALPGKANRLTSRWCRKVLLGLKAAAPYFKPDKVVITGTPVRQELTAPLRQDRARATFGLPSDGYAVLVMGGSQGAKQLNSVVVEAAQTLQSLEINKTTSHNNSTPPNTKTSAQKAAELITATAPMAPLSGSTRQRTVKQEKSQASSIIHFLHITGAADYERIKDLTKDIQGYQVIPFCDDMAAAYAACDASICRAGASSMTELSYVGMPSILVPYPYAADDHQTVNAQVFQKAGAAILRQESELDTSTLVDDLTQIFQEDIHQSMSQNCESLAVKDAANQICQVITS
jgi:UDP-N-acetylglucosamine--N-acetylmuramyl-(pentapeptide) pyrophosphoryl-undecaprenol N-acetylglucosamine transferase